MFELTFMQDHNYLYLVRKDNRAYRELSVVVMATNFNQITDNTLETLYIEK